MTLITCPCCHGTGWLVTHHDDPAVIQRDPCTHCQGKGEVEAEVDEKKDDAPAH